MGSPNFNIVAVAHMQIFIINCPRISISHNKAYNPRMRKYLNLDIKLQVYSIKR
jgi:hypothetical protein